jgi:hypothetical protein
VLGQAVLRSGREHVPHSTVGTELNGR